MENNKRTTPDANATAGNRRPARKIHTKEEEMALIEQAWKEIGPVIEKLIKEDRWHIQ